jgi:hypothetical protein
MCCFPSSYSGLLYRLPHVAFDNKLKLGGEHAEFDLHVELRRSFTRVNPDCQCNM